MVLRRIGPNRRGLVLAARADLGTTVRLHDQPPLSVRVVVPERRVARYHSEEALDVEGAERGSCGFL